MGFKALPPIRGEHRPHAVRYCCQIMVFLAAFSSLCHAQVGIAVEYCEDPEKFDKNGRLTCTSLVKLDL